MIGRSLQILNRKITAAIPFFSTVTLTEWQRALNGDEETYDLPGARQKIHASLYVRFLRDGLELQTRELIGWNATVCRDGS